MASLVFDDHSTPSIAARDYCWCCQGTFFGANGSYAWQHSHRSDESIVAAKYLEFLVLFLSQIVTLQMVKSMPMCDCNHVCGEKEIPAMSRKPKHGLGSGIWNPTINDWNGLNCYQRLENTGPIDKEDIANEE
eukprot:15329140-Ditylum_brightwellii.AAC.1